MVQLSQRLYRQRRRLFIIFAVIIIVFNLARIRSVEVEHTVRDANLEEIIEDVDIERCLRWRRCKLKEGWEKTGSKLNKYSIAFTIYDYYLVVKRLPTQSASKAVVDIMLGNVALDEDKTQWVEKTSLSHNVWVKYISGSEQNLERAKVVRDVQVLYGEQDLVDMRPGWTFHPDACELPFNTVVPMHLSLFKLSQEDAKSYLHHRLHFSNLKQEGEIVTDKPVFKVMQISDLHFSSLAEVCDKQGCRLDSRTLHFVENSLDQEDIDLVVITGDLIDFEQSVDFKSVILKGLAPLFKKNIPFIFTFGELDSTNGDNKLNSYTKSQVLRFVTSLPNCYNYLPSASDGIHGFTNYNIKVYQRGKYRPDMLITVLDSESRKVDSSQVNYLYRVNQDFNYRITKLLFFHYPLPNFRPVGKFKFVGKYDQQHKLNSNTDPSFRDDIAALNYNVVSVGHEHENDACIASEKFRNKADGEILNQIWLCYNGVTGDAAKTSINAKGVERTSRIFEITFETQTLLSWKRSEERSIAYDFQKMNEF